MPTQRLNESDEEYKKKFAAYQRARYAKKKAIVVESMGGKCVDCGFTKGLEFDHVDPKLKLHNITRIIIGGKAEALAAELAKCVLRCVACHQHMTAFQKLQSTDVLMLL
jgi:hypothetical protein